MRIGANETLGELKPRIQVSVYPSQDSAECLGAWLHLFANCMVVDAIGQ